MKEQIEACKEFVKNETTNRFDGHDYAHVERVYKNEIKIAEKEGANKFVCCLAALLHEVDDEPIGGKYLKGYDCPKAKALLESLNVDPRVIDWVCEIINNMSFRKTNNHLRTVEAKVVMDADMLDAIGAIGIARAFQAGAVNGKMFYEGNIQDDTVIRDFYVELLNVTNKFNTRTGKELALQRREFMENFLQEFFFECGVKIK